jgi:hypothetical protein
LTPTSTSIGTESTVRTRGLGHPSPPCPLPASGGAHLLDELARNGRNVEGGWGSTLGPRRPSAPTANGAQPAMQSLRENVPDEHSAESRASQPAVHSQRGERGSASMTCAGPFGATSDVTTRAASRRGGAPNVQHDGLRECLGLCPAHERLTHLAQHGLVRVARAAHAAGRRAAERTRRRDSDS